MKLQNAQGTFQEKMNFIYIVFIADFSVDYWNYFLIYSNRKEEQARHLRLALKQLRETQLFLGKNEYELVTSKT